MMGTRARAESTADEATAVSVRTDRPRARSRRLPWIAAGLLVIALSVLVFVVALGRVSTRVPVVAVSRDVAAGEVLTGEDLTVVDVAVDAAAAVTPGERRGEFVGRVAGGPLPAGTLLAEGMLRAGAAVPAGVQVVGLALQPGEYPVSNLAVGDRVSVVSSASADVESGVLGVGEVWAVEPLGDVAGALFVSVAVPDDAAPAVAAAAGRNEARVTWLGAGR